MPTGAGITVSIVNAGGDEKLQIDAAASAPRQDISGACVLAFVNVVTTFSVIQHYFNKRVTLDLYVDGTVFGGPNPTITLPYNAGSLIVTPLMWTAPLRHQDPAGWQDTPCCASIAPGSPIILLSGYSQNPGIFPFGVLTLQGSLSFDVDF
jgi:hypothetical protein